METLKEIARAHKGFITASQATARDIQRRKLREAAEAGELIRVDRGLYCLPETWEDEYVIAQHRYTRGIFSHDTALYLLGLSDQAPELLTMSFPSGYNTSLARRFGIITRIAPKNCFDLGKSIRVTPYGNDVIVYGAERTLCDMLRGVAEPDKQIVSPAMRAYLSSPARDLIKLQEYAQRLGVSEKVRGYLEILL